MNYESYPVRLTSRTIRPADVVWDPCSTLYTVHKLCYLILLLCCGTCGVVSWHFHAISVWHKANFWISSGPWPISRSQLAINQARRITDCARLWCLHLGTDRSSSTDLPRTAVVEPVSYWYTWYHNAVVLIVLYNTQQGRYWRAFD